jgi:hypothetical protein
VANIFGSRLDAIVSAISFCVGHTSLRNTGLPSVPVPRGSRSKSTSTLPASAYATTSGGEAR